MFYRFSNFNIGFSFISVLVTVIFVIVIGMFVVMAIKGIGQWNKNNHSPRLTVPVTVVAKRTNVSHQHHHHGTGMHHTSASTTYYVTFQVESGDRMEFHIPAQEFGLLIEGDRGMLTFQGTRYMGFARRIGV